MRPPRPKRRMILLFLIQAQHHTVLAQSSEITDQSATITPSTALIIAALIAALFFVGFFSIYVRHCTSTRSRPAASRGLDSSVIDTFPLLHYSEVKALKIGNGALACAVCLNDFDDGETLRFIPKCDHVFHYNCIDAWLASHVTCPVCRADLGSSSGRRLAESTHLEAASESGRVERCNELNENINNNDVEEEESLNRRRTRGSRSGSTRGWRFLKSHSTGHSLVQPGENTDRFTLKLPDEVRKQIMNRQLDRSMSLVEFPRERSWRRGYRVGSYGSSSGKYRELEKLGEPADRSDRWVFTRSPSFLTRASSFLTRASSSIIRSTKVTVNDGEAVGPDVKEPSRPSV